MSGRRDGASMPRIRMFPMSIDDCYAERLWTTLRSAIQEIQRKNNSGLSFEELYRNAYTMVLHKRGQRLYSGLKEVVTEHLVASVRANVLSAINSDDRGFLYALNVAWTEHQTSMIMIRDILMYMDRVYVSQTNCDSVYDLGLKLFRDEIVRFDSIGDHLRQTLLTMVMQDRQGGLIDRTIVKSTCEMLIVLGINSRHVYEEDFETHFIRMSVLYYEQQSQRLISQNSIPLYLSNVEQLIEDERERVRRYLDVNTDSQIVEKLEHELIHKHLHMIVDMPNSGLVHMIVNNRVGDLRRMYELLARLNDGHKAMIEAMSAHLRAHGIQLVGGKMSSSSSGQSVAQEDVAPTVSQATAEADSVSTVSSTDAATVTPTRKATDSQQSVQQQQQQTPIGFIQSVLDLKDRYDSLLERAFCSNRQFKQAITSDFEHFFNMNDRSAEYLSLYIDEKLRKGSSGATKQTASKSGAHSILSDADMERILDKTIILFRLLAEKDSFAEYFKRHLSRRLLNQKSVSDDWERLLIAKLKTECGCQFTYKLEGMCKDIAVSQTINDEYRAYLSHEQQDATDAPPIDLSVRVLTTGFWPGQSTPLNVRLPAHVMSAFEKFKSYYVGTKSGRVLALQPAFGTVDLLAYFCNNVNMPAKRHDSTSSTMTDDGPSSSTTPTSGISSKANGGQIVPSACTDANSNWRKHILCVTTPQMAILMLFNANSGVGSSDGPTTTSADSCQSSKMISFRAIAEATGLPDKDVVRALQPLAVGKMSQRILVKSPRSKEIETGPVANNPSVSQEGAYFSVNDSFVSSFYRIKVQQMASISSSGATRSGGLSTAPSSTSTAETESERAETRRRLDEARKHEIDACLVRIMKARRSLQHNELVSEVIGQLNRRFVPSPSSIKNRIETLIERDYIKRSDTNRNIYWYVA